MRVNVTLSIEVDSQAWLDWTSLEDKSEVPEDVANLLAELAAASRTFSETGATVISAVAR